MTRSSRSRRIADIIISEVRVGEKKKYKVTAAGASTCNSCESRRRVHVNIACSSLRLSAHTIVCAQAATRECRGEYNELT